MHFELLLLGLMHNVIISNYYYYFVTFCLGFRNRNVCVLTSGKLMFIGTTCLD